MAAELSHLRLYGSLRNRRILQVIATLALMAGLATGSPLPAVGAVGLAASLLLVAALIRIPDVECAFCRRPRREVTNLIAAISVSICDDCLPWAMTPVNEASLRAGSGRWLLDVLASLPAHSPRAISRPLILAARRTDPAQRERLIRQSFRLSNEPALIEMFALVPEDERGPSEWINLGVAFEREGRTTEALEALTHVAADPEQEPWVLNNGAASRVAIPETDVEALKKLVGDNTRARRLIEEPRPPGWEKVMAAMLETAAELQLRLGALEPAREHLRQAERLDTVPSASRCLTEARIALAGSQPEAARRALDRVVELAHPESSEAKKANALIFESGLSATPAGS